MIIGNEYRFAQNYPLLNMHLAFLTVVDFLTLTYSSRCIPDSWNYIKSPLFLHRQT